MGIVLFLIRMYWCQSIIGSKEIQAKIQAPPEEQPGFWSISLKIQALPEEQPGFLPDFLLSKGILGILPGYCRGFYRGNAHKTAKSPAVSPAIAEHFTEHFTEHSLCKT